MARLAMELAEEEPSLTGITTEIFSAFYTRYVQVGTALLELIQESVITEAVGREQNSGETVRSKPRHQGQKGWRYQSTYVSEATLQLVRLDQSFHRMVLEKKQDAAGGAEKNKNRKRKAGADSTTTVVRTVAVALTVASETQDQQERPRRRRRVAGEHPAPPQQSPQSSPQSSPPPPTTHLNTKIRQQSPKRDDVRDLNEEDGCALDSTVELMADDPSRELHDEDMSTLDQLFPYPHPATAYRHLNTQQSRIYVQKGVPPTESSQGQEAPSDQSSQEQEAASTQFIQEQQEHTHPFDQTSAPTANNNTKEDVTTTAAIVEDSNTHSADEIPETTPQLLEPFLILEETMRSFSRDIKAQMTQMASTLETYQLQMTQFKNAMESQQAQMTQALSAIEAQQFQTVHLRNVMETQQSESSGVQDTYHALNKRTSLSGTSINIHRTLDTPDCDVLNSTTATSPTRTASSGVKGTRADLVDARGGTLPPSPPPSAGPSRSISTLTLDQALTTPWNSNLTSTSSSIPNTIATDSLRRRLQGHTPQQQAPTSYNPEFDATVEALAVSTATMSVMGTSIWNESRTGSHRLSHQEPIRSSSKSGSNGRQA